MTEIDTPTPSTPRLCRDAARGSVALGVAVVLTLPVGIVRLLVVAVSINVQAL